MRLILGTFSTLGLGLALASAAAAQSVGMQVVDTSGAPVGTVIAINGDNVQIKTDKHDVLLPKSSFTLNNGKLLFGMTQAQLDQSRKRMPRPPRLLLQERLSKVLQERRSARSTPSRAAMSRLL
ncbi:MAG TPA: hypothetical protein VE968_03410 [Sphingomicrobium sp.]|nr:hypothetical protein [Sphingomicrobium sp.]